MQMILGIRRHAGIVAIMALAVALSACAGKKDGLVGLGGPDRGGAATPGSVQEFLANVGDRVFFTTDSTDLTTEAQATLDKQAQWLNMYPNYKVLIEGHADERGTREYNIALGARRATVTKNYLAQRGVVASRITTTSFGKERPVAVCNDISCWSQNRRAVTVPQ
jgi:peptidoglycan-associated lipoprotein